MTIENCKAIYRGIVAVFEHAQKSKIFDIFKMSKKKEEQQRQEKMHMEISRLYLPRGMQCFGVIEQRLGGSRMRVRCLDGKTRICRIPGRLTRKLWVRESDIAVVEPWEYGGDEKGDIIYKYTPTQVSFLKRKGYLKQLDEFEEF